MSFENLEVHDSDDWAKADAEAPPFAPSAGQWNALVGHVSSLKADLKKAAWAVLVLSEVTEDRFELADDQVVHLRGSIGSRPCSLEPNLPALDLWTNMVKLSSEVADAQENLGKQKASVCECATRDMAEASVKGVRKNLLN